MKDLVFRCGCGVGVSVRRGVFVFGGLEGGRVSDFELGGGLFFLFCF